MSFTNLVRFKDEAGKILYGDCPESALDKIVGTSVPVLNGDPLNGGLSSTGDTAVIKEVLAPIQDTPIFLCVGWNYADHIIETKAETPPNPVLFTKPSNAIAGPFEDVEVPDHAYLLDWEGELSFILSKDGKDIAEGEADEYILGYTSSNDLSARYWQRNPYSGGQFCYAKSFDKFAPIGPTIRATAKTEVSNLRLRTWVNGVERQNSLTRMLFNPQQILAHLSKGTTLRKGTVIMTGTPRGVASRMTPPGWLQQGDVIEVNISQIGSVKNKLI